MKKTTYRTAPKKTSHRQGRRLILLAVLIIVLAGVLGYAYKRHHDKTVAKVVPSTTANTINYAPPTKDTNSANDARKSSSTPSSTLDNGSTPTSTPTTYTVHILNAVATGSSVHVGTLVEGTTTGTCTLTATQSGQANVTQTASVHSDVNSYDCGAFNITLGSGTWNLSLVVTNGSQQASDTTTVTID